jgi:catechol 2,3-dioxygenase-like lactoylglutathione lyase family enzyme
MNLKVGPFQIFVSDIKQAQKWYSKALGMKLIESYPKVKCVLVKLGRTEFDIGVPNPTWGRDWKKVKVGGLSPIFFETDDIFKTCRALKKKGVKLIEEPQKKSWGEYKAIFVDPDGNEFSLIQVA